LAKAFSRPFRTTGLIQCSMRNWSFHRCVSESATQAWLTTENRFRFAAVCHAVSQVSARGECVRQKRYARVRPIAACSLTWSSGSARACRPLRSTFPGTSSRLLHSRRAS